MSVLRTRRRILAVAISGTVVTALGILGITTALAADAGPIKGPGGRCADVAGANSANGTAVQLWDCSLTGAQSWQLPGATSTPTTVPATTAPATGTKKGVSTWEFPGVSGAVTDVGAGWYYNWGTDNDKMPAGAEFVPMIWDENVVTAANLAKVKTEGTTLLGFNEPDLDGQAEMDVKQALDLWPQLQATGMRLGSPAVAYGGDTPGGWLDQFMKGAEERKLKVDFITLHWYGSDFSDAATGQFMGYVKAVHDRYQKPIWVTEYGLMNFTGTPKFPTTAQITSFIRNSTAQLQAAPYVERYAWFSLPAVGDSVDYGLYRDATTPTEAGKAYRAAGS
jgi:hypothetical protein